MTTTQTDSQRARKRATQSRLRALYHAPTIDRTTGRPHTGPGWYTVHNLTSGRKYKVYYVIQGNYPGWRCECEASPTTRCKHIQRVLDREERRTKAEALTDG